MPVDPGILDLLRMLPYLGLFRKYAMPVSALAERIGDPSARDLFVSALDWHSQSAFFVMMMLGYMARKAAGYPIGGSVPLARALESRFLALGGSIKYGSKVAGIIIEDNRANGVILDDGTRISSDMVLSAADGHTTLFSWIPERYVPEKIKAYYNDLELFPPLVFVSLGMKGTHTEIPRSASFPVREPATIAGIPVTRLFVRNHAHDPTLAPVGKTALSVMIETDYDYWAEIPYHSEQYRQEKDRIGSLVVDALEEFFPGTKEQVEVIDVATPHTFVRYTGNWHGSYEGWLWTRKTMNLRFPQVLPGLGSFYMAGQWVAPGGGLPGAALSARSAVAQLCKDKGRHFVTSKPSES